MKTVDDMFEDHGPMTDDNHVGIEIECFTQFDHDILATKLVGTPLADYVTIKGDRSIKPSCPRHEMDEWACRKEDCDINVQGVELTLLVPESQYGKILNEFGKFLKSMDARVNSTCGLHVHLDMRNRDPRAAYNRLYRAQTLLAKMCHGNRLTTNYCNVLDKSTYKEIRDQFEHTYDFDRFFIVNAGAYCKHDTIEIRVHQGTVNMKEVTEWVDILLKIISVKLTKPVRTLTDIKLLQPDAKLRAAIRGRVLKYRASHYKAKTTKLLKAA